MYDIEDIRHLFRIKKINQEFRGNGTIELIGTSFRVTDDVIFGKANQDYIDSEIKWYESQSLNVNDLFEIYGKEVKIWKEISDEDGYINSNYGWCIYSQQNGMQYQNVLKTLRRDPLSRQGVMIYTNPRMHSQASLNGRRDFMCTNSTQYILHPCINSTSVYLEAIVNMRSNDVVYGFINDIAWHRHVLKQLAEDLGVMRGSITWNAGSLHVYERDYDKIV